MVKDLTKVGEFKRIWHTPGRMSKYFIHGTKNKIFKEVIRLLRENPSKTILRAIYEAHADIYKSKNLVLKTQREVKNIFNEVMKKFKKYPIETIRNIYMAHANIWMGEHKEK